MADQRTQESRVSPSTPSAGFGVDEWVERWQAGIEPEEAFRQIFGRYYRVIFSVFAKRGIPSEESQDLAQETFLRIFRSISTYRRDLSSFETWLFQVAENVRRNALRSKSTQKRDALMVPIAEEVGLNSPPLLSASEQDPLEDALAKERSRLLHEAVAELPAQMRRCVLLRIDQELEYREIADLLCCLRYPPLVAIRDLFLRRLDQSLFF